MNLYWSTQKSFHQLLSTYYQFIYKHSLRNVSTSTPITIIQSNMQTNLCITLIHKCICPTYPWPSDLPMALWPTHGPLIYPIKWSNKTHCSKTFNKLHEVWQTHGIRAQSGSKIQNIAQNFKLRNTQLFCNFRNPTFLSWRILFKHLSKSIFGIMSLLHALRLFK